jgi:ribosomal protein S18 acetylase RimI-like enzyme
VKSFRGPDDGAYDPQVPELTYLATAEHHRGSGIGRQLVDAFDTAMRERGAPAFELSVDEDNQAAIAFYERLGFRLSGKYREFGIVHRRYRRELNPPTVVRAGASP